jgi:hypothetical protein
VHHFEASDRRVSSLHRLEPECRLDPTFELAVVGLDDVIAIFDLSIRNSVWKLTLAFERRECLSVPGRVELPSVVLIRCCLPATCRREGPLSVCFLLGEHRLPAVIADEVKRDAKRYDILEEKQSKIVHVSQALPLDGRARCRKKHGAGDEEHQRSDERSNEASLWAYVPDDEQYRGRDFGCTDNV